MEILVDHRNDLKLVFVEFIVVRNLWLDLMREPLFSMIILKSFTQLVVEGIGTLVSICEVYNHLVFVHNFFFLLNQFLGLEEHNRHVESLVTRRLLFTV